MVDQAVLAATKHMDSGVRTCVPICLTRHGKAVEGFLDTVRDEKLASHFDACHGPSMMFLGRTTHDDAKDVHLYPANQRKGVVDRMQEQLHACLVLDNRTSETCPNGLCRVLPPSCRAILLSCARYRVDLFGVATRQPLSVADCSVAVERLIAAMAPGSVVLAMAAQWPEVQGYSVHPSIVDQQDAQTVQVAQVD